MADPFSALQSSATPPAASGVSEPSPSFGTQANAVAEIRTAIQILQKAIGTLDPGTKEGQVVLEVIKKLAQIAPASKSTEGVEATSLNEIRQKMQQNAMMSALMQQHQGGQPPAGGVPTPPPAS